MLTLQGAIEKSPILLSQYWKMNDWMAWMNEWAISIVTLKFFDINQFNFHWFVYKDLRFVHYYYQISIIWKFRFKEFLMNKVQNAHRYAVSGKKDRERDEEKNRWKKRKRERARLYRKHENVDTTLSQEKVTRKGYLVYYYTKVNNL